MAVIAPELVKAISRIGDAVLYAYQVRRDEKSAFDRAVREFVLGERRQDAQAVRDRERDVHQAVLSELGKEEDLRRRELELEKKSSLAVRSEVELDELRELPFTGLPQGFRALVAAESWDGQLPVVLFAPLVDRDRERDRGDGRGKSRGGGWGSGRADALDELLYEMCAALGTGEPLERMAVRTGFLRRPLIRSDWDVAQIRTALRDLPVILVHGHVVGDRISVSIAAWNMVSDDKGTALRWQLPAVRLGPDHGVDRTPAGQSGPPGLPGPSEPPGPPEADPASIAASIALIAAALAETFHLMHTGRLPTLHRQVEADGGQWAMAVAEILAAGLRLAVDRQLVASLDAVVSQAEICAATGLFAQAEALVADLLGRLATERPGNPRHAVRALENLELMCADYLPIAAQIPEINGVLVRLVRDILADDLKESR